MKMSEESTAAALEKMKSYAAQRLQSETEKETNVKEKKVQTRQVSVQEAEASIKNN